MKQIFLPFLVFSFAIFIISCDSEMYNFESHSIENFEAEQVFFQGEVQESSNAKVSPVLFGCGVSGPNCAVPQQTLTYSYSTAAINPNITWIIDSGNISILGGQGTETVSLYFGSNFSGGYVTVLGDGVPNCSVTFEILKCGDIAPLPCGIDVTGVYELNQLGGDDVVFYATTNVNSESVITSSFFTVTYQDGSISLHVGYTNVFGYQQIIVPVDCPQEKVRKVEVNVYGISNSGINCSDTKICDWGTIGVCGTGNFN